MKKCLAILLTMILCLTTLFECEQHSRGYYHERRHPEHMEKCLFNLNNWKNKETNKNTSGNSSSAENNSSNHSNNSINSGSSNNNSSNMNSSGSSNSSSSYKKEQVKCYVTDCKNYTSPGCGSYCAYHHNKLFGNPQKNTPASNSSNSKYSADPYDVELYDDAEDFADDWEDDFDDWDEAYDYYEEHQ